MGGVFIATLVGLGIAMVVLAFEVYFHRKDQKNAVQDLTLQGHGGKQPFQHHQQGARNVIQVGSKEIHM